MDIIGKEYIVAYILMLIFNIWYILDKRKQLKDENYDYNPMDYVRLYEAYASFFFIIILLVLSICSD